MDEGAEKPCTPGGRWELAAHLVRDRRLGLAMVGGGLLYFAAAAFGFELMPCPFKSLSGLPCPGCGMTRACFALLDGNFHAVGHLNPFGPVFGLFWAVVGVGVALPEPWRARFARRLGVIERRTRWVAWVACCLVIYSLTRWIGFW